MKASADHRQIQARYPPRGMLAHLVDLITLQSQNLIVQMQFRERFQRENSFSLPINKGHRGTLTFKIRPRLGKITAKIVKTLSVLVSDFYQRR